MIKVYPIKEKHIYPIFKNGLSSVTKYAIDRGIRPLINGQLRKLDHVTVYLRDPAQRFISGVHSFIEFEKRKTNIDYNTVVHLVGSHGLTNEHFEPQYNWIKRLASFFKADLELLSTDELMKLIDNRDEPEIPNITKEQRKVIGQIQPDHRADRELLQYVGRTIPIQTIIERINNVLPQT